MKLLAAVTLVCAVSLQGCDDLPRACTLIGGTNGIGVVIPKALFVPSGRIFIEVCDQRGCVKRVRPLPPQPRRFRRDDGRSSPTERVVPLTFQQLGRSFEPGQVTMRVRVFRGHGHLFAAADRELELTRSYPNGKDCDGDGWVTGYLDLTAADRVRP